MCEPITISTGAAWALGISAAVAAAGAAVAYNAQKEQGKASAKIAENNARMAEDQKRDALAIGDVEGQKAAWRSRQVIGAQRAAIAANNLDPGIGTPNELVGEAAMFGEVDQQTIRLNAARNAWGFNARAIDARNQGKLSKWSSNQQANATLLSGLANTASAVGGFYG